MKMIIKRTPKEELIKYGDLIEIVEKGWNDIGIYHNYDNNYLTFYSLKHKVFVKRYFVDRNQIKKIYGEIILKNE